MTDSIILPQKSKSIILTKGKHVIVDDEDYIWLSKWKWLSSSTNYAARNIRIRSFDGKSKTKMIMMHRIIMNTPTGMCTDHINGNTLDNRKCNLRICTYAENMKNSNKRKGLTSMYKGVSWRKKDRKWVSQIKHNNKIHILGKFINEMDAALAYDFAAIKYFGEFAKLNLGVNCSRDYHLYNPWRAYNSG